MGRWAAYAILVLLLALTIAVPGDVQATINPVNRVFYLSDSPPPTPRALSPTPPPSGAPSADSFADGPLEFVLPSRLFNSITVSGTIVFSLWMSSNVSATVPIILSLGGGINLTTPQVLERINTVPENHTFRYLVPFSTGFPLFFGEQISLSIRATPPNGANVTLSWGSSLTSSRVILPLTGYEAVSNVQTLDGFQKPTTTFNLNATLGNNIVIIQASVASAFGFSDIQNVNLTVMGPNLKPVKIGPDGETSMPMELSPISPPFPFTLFYRWPYPSNSTEGVYQIFIDVIDSQNNTAFSFRGPTTFILTQGQFPIPPSLIPYLAGGGVGGVGLIAGLLYYRRRKAKSYLLPFDYFNTLTGGEINSGTVVTIEGNTGSGKTILSQQLMFEDLKNGRPCVFVATGDFPSNIRAGMRNLGLDVTGYEQSGLLTFVDGYSSEAGQESKEKFSIPSLSDLTTFGIKITSSLPTGSFKGGSLYFDSLTPLASKAKPESIVSLVQSVGARVKGMSGKAFFTVGPSVEPKVQRQLEELSDCVVQMEAFEERGVRKSRLKVAKYRARKYQQGWVLYTIEDGKGIIFYSKKPRK